MVDHPKNILSLNFLLNPEGGGKELGNVQGALFPSMSIYGPSQLLPQQQVLGR